VTARQARLPRSAWLTTGTAIGAGVVAVGQPGWLAVSTGAATLAAGLAGWAMRAGPFRQLAALGIGLVAVGLRILIGPAAASPPPLAAAGSGPWMATVESIGSPRDGDQVARLRLRTADGTLSVAATLPGYPVVNAGDRIEVDGRLRPPPEDDPYGAYLTRTGASGSLDGRATRVIGPAPAVSVQALRDRAGDALALALPEPEAGLAAGILIGLRERVDRDLAATFSTAGTSHIVAISGWNIAIVAGIVALLLRGRPRRIIALLTGATIAGYVVAAGASPSIVRAAVMASVVLIARESGRAGRAPAALALAAASLLLVSPEMIADAGFRLSVAATAGLLAWATPLGAAIGRVAGGRVPRWLAGSLGISLAAQAATLPDVLATFERLSLVAPVVNLLVVPIVPPAMAAGLLALIGGASVLLGAPAWIATVAGLPAWVLLHVMVAVVRFGAALPVAAVSLPPELGPPAGLAAGVTVALLLAWERRQRAVRRGRGIRPGAAGPHALKPGPSSHRPQNPRFGVAARAALVTLLIVGSIGTGVVVSSTTGTTRLTVLDVGQGDAILLESARGARMLVDGGPDPGRLTLLLDERLPPWDRRIDVMVLTHPHEDHVAGLVRVLGRYTVGRVYEPGMHGPGPGWRAWNDALGRGSPGRGTLAAGQQLRLDEIRLDVLWPELGTVPVEPGATGRAINDVSIVLLGTANGHRFLLTGDAEDDVDPALVAGGLPRVDLLKVAHHGSATATSQLLLDALRPSVAVISVGAHNDYGHPAPSTLDRLEAVGARVYRTDRDGTVTIELEVGRMVVRTSGSRTGYDRDDDHPRSPYGRDAVALARARRLVPAPRLRGRRRRRVAGARGGRPRCVGGSSTRGSRGPAARHRQAAGRPRGRSPPSRRGFRHMAGITRPRGACTGRSRPPGDAARGRAVRDLGVDGVSRGANRRLR
jgi:competence protein ComEC